MAEIVELPRRVVPQPKPAIHKGGDCSACVLGGVLGIPTVREVYETFFGGKPKALSRHEMVAAVEDAEWKLELLDRVISDIPHWPALPNTQIWGQPGWGQNLAWYAYVRMAIDAGYYGIASISYAKQGPPAESDHVVLICGVRVREEPTRIAKAFKLTHEILVSCSAAHPEGRWVDHNEFLEAWGGYNVILVRPAA